MNFQFKKALDILGRTFPFVALRLLVYAIAFGLGFLWFALMFGLFTNWPFPGPPWLAFVFGGVLFGTGAKLIRNYVLYLVKAAHIAVITRLAVSGSLPDGANQFSYGWSLVGRRFLEVSVLFAVDRVVHVVVRAFNRSVFKLISFIPGIQGFRGFARQVLDYSAGYVDEAVLSYSIVNEDKSPWVSAREGLVLYVQNWKTVLGSGLVLAMMSYVFVAIVAAPGAIAGYLFGGAFFQFWIAGSVALGFFLKFAVMDPFALTAVIINYHAAIEGQSPDFTLENQLEQASSKYRKIKEKAGDWVGTSGVATPPPPPQTGPVEI